LFIYGRASLAMEGKSVVPMEITFMDNGGKHKSYYVNSWIIQIHVYEVVPINL